MTPAVRDPKTEKVYTGDYHGDIIDSLPKDVKLRIIRSYKRTTSQLYNYDGPNVGFVDSKGKFMPRAEADKLYQLQGDPSSENLEQEIENTRSKIGNLRNRLDMNFGNEYASSKLRWFKSLSKAEQRAYLKTL